MQPASKRDQDRINWDSWTGAYRRRILRSHRYNQGLYGVIIVPWEVYEYVSNFPLQPPLLGVESCGIHIWSGEKFWPPRIHPYEYQSSGQAVPSKTKTSTRSIHHLSIHSFIHPSIRPSTQALRRELVRVCGPTTLSERAGPYCTKVALASTTPSHPGKYPKAGLALRSAA